MELKQDLIRRLIAYAQVDTQSDENSEYETYGNFVYSRYPGSVQLRTALNRGLHGRASRLTPQRSKELAAKYRSVSFHERKGYVRSGSKAAGRNRRLSLRGRTFLPREAAALKGGRG